MQVGDLVKDNFYGRIGIITKKGTAKDHISGRTSTVYLVTYIPDGRNFRSPEKWMEPQYFKKIS